LSWGLDAVVAASSVPASVVDSIDGIVSNVVGGARAGDHIVIMSNGGFGGIHDKMAAALKARFSG
jgi:UDP-N-acetylmuramate: L-alanyl-gamma-D-glutamyl-meso-diaminopimelate ligase